MSYALVLLNAIFAFLFKTGKSVPNPTKYILLLLDGLLVGALIFFSVQGYNTSNNCAANTVLYQFDFIEAVIAIVVTIFILALNTNWAERYTNWPGNLAWPILFLGTKGLEAYQTAGLVIGVAMAVVCTSSFIVNMMVYSLTDFTSKKEKMMNFQWGFAMFLKLGCELYAIYLLVATDSKSSGYADEMGRKCLVIFAGVNALDMCFWAWGKKYMGVWTLLSDF